MKIVYFYKTAGKKFKDLKVVELKDYNLDIIKIENKK
jgi:hypothetical protein